MLARVRARRLQLVDGLVHLPGPQQAHAQLKTVHHLGREAVRLAPVQLQLAAVDLAHQPQADLPQALVLRCCPLLLLGQNEVAAKHLDVQVGDLDGDLEGVAGRAESFRQGRPCLLDLPVLAQQR